MEQGNKRTDKKISYVETILTNRTAENSDKYKQHRQATKEMITKAKKDSWTDFGKTIF